jgi:hypothetical protein
VKSEQIKRQIFLLEQYLKSRIQQLDYTIKHQPGETVACEAAKAELQLIYDNILPELNKAIK